MTQRFTYGIDFGTCNSVIEIYDHEQDQVVDTTGHFENALESSIYFPPGQTFEYFLGEEALNLYLGADLKGRFIKSLKSALSAPFLNELTVERRRIELIELVSYFIEALKRGADAFLGVEVDRVILGRPTQFSGDPMEDRVAEERLVKAAKKAGFRHIKLLQEPIAAGVSFQALNGESQNILIGDIGAGTSDFALIQSAQSLDGLFNGSNQIQTSGVKRGGDDFDAHIMWDNVVDYFGYGSEYESYQRMLPIPAHIYWGLCYWDKLSVVNKQELLKSLQKFHHASPDKEKIARMIYLIEQNLGFQLLKRVEKAKQHLSSDTATQIQFASGKIALDQQLMSDQFEACIEQPLEEIEAALDALPADQVDAVCLTGGSTLLPAVRGVFEQRFGAARIQAGNPFKSVAMGLAGAARYLDD